MTGNQVALPPYVLRWAFRDMENADCGIVAIQLATGLTYESVLAAALKVKPHPISQGFYLTDIMRVLNRLGLKATTRKTYDIQEDTGILHAAAKGKKEQDHVTYLWKGRIVEPGDQMLWLDPEDYLKFNKYRAATLIVIEEGKK